jgi:hypothetical protein
LLSLDRYTLGFGLRLFQSALSWIEVSMTNALMPMIAPPVLRRGMSGAADGLGPLGCSWWKWAACAGEIAVCAGLSGPAFIACVASVAADCLECVT